MIRGTDLREELRALGLDPDQVAERFICIAQKALENSPTHWRARVERERVTAIDIDRHSSQPRRQRGS